MFSSIYKIFTSFQQILWPSSRACQANYDFLSRPTSPIFHSPDSIYDGIVHSICFGKQGAPDGSQGTYVSSFKHAYVIDDQVGCPCKEPQRNGHQCNLVDSANRHQMFWKQSNNLLISYQLSKYVITIPNHSCMQEAEITHSSKILTTFTMVRSYSSLRTVFFSFF